MVGVGVSNYAMAELSDVGAARADDRTTSGVTLLGIAKFYFSAPYRSHHRKAGPVIYKDMGGKPTKLQKRVARGFGPCPNALWSQI